MNSVLVSRLRAIEDNTYRNLGILDLIITRGLATNWVFLNIFINLIFDTVITSCVLLLSFGNYVNRNKKAILFIAIVHTLFKFVLDCIAYFLYESIG